MPRFARLNANNIAVEIYVGDKLFPMHETLAAAWVPAPDNVVEGQVYDKRKKSFSDPPPAPPAPPRLSEAVILRRALQDKGGPIITDDDMKAAKQALINSS